MAYLDIDDMFAPAARSFAHAAATISPAATADAGFRPLEWSVIALAKRDTLRSLSEPSRLSRAMGSLFGQETPSRLADPRLEALRRMAVYAWRHGFALPKAEIERFLSAGFAEQQIETLVTSVTGMRVGATKRSGSA
ncbi:hypothetical protein [Sphingomonas montana]|uniref:hypothetical protein n=1 Tax=Sphingomonas montana TaxID=1843236 RepID=UPI00096FA158|nr:hypothetical protein [Sphingomonas montana]